MHGRRSRVLRELALAALTVILLGQAGVALSAVTLPAGSTDVECHCPPGMNHGACPMHHTTGGRQRCLLRGAQSPSDSALLALLASFAAPTRFSVTRPANPSAPIPSAVFAADSLRSAPDIPPPRF